MFSGNWRRVELGIILISLLLAAFGLFMIYATGSGTTKGEYPLYFAKRQLIWAAVGIVLMTISALFDYTRLKHSFTFIYVINLLLLIGIAIFGEAKLGAQRWFTIGSFQFQPSEFAKLAAIITMAAYAAKFEGSISQFSNVAIALGYITPSLLLILMQPDLGTAMVIIAVALGMLLPAGTQIRHYLILLLIGLIFFIAVFQFGLLKDYQVKRLVVFLNPDVDPQGSGYNLRQSMIAIGSGGLWGKGIFSGTQSRLNFIPERHTDFIFAVIGEELGFMGGAGLIFVFFLLISRTLRIAAGARNFFGLLLATGIASMWIFQILVNIGMTIGIMPITGIPLPFISYGGSAMFTNMISVGLLLSIYARRFR